jgi:HSP20 family protein
MPIVKYTPYADFETIPSFRSLEDTINRFFTQPTNGRPWVPPVDIRETEHAIVLQADVPDVKFEDIDIRLENGTLTLKGERKFSDDKKEGGWHRVERSYGTFERAFSLPDTVNPDGTKADYKNGVLTITVPKKENAKPRQVKVQLSNT